MTVTRLDMCRRYVASVRHSALLDMEVLSAEADRVRVRLPWREDLVGNPETGVFHGGAIFTLVDQAGGLANSCAVFPDFELTPTIDMRIDHLHAPRPGRGVVCESECYRLTAHVAFVRSTVHEEHEGQPVGEPVAYCVATYMRMKIPGIGKVVSA